MAFAVNDSNRFVSSGPNKSNAPHGPNRSGINNSSPNRLGTANNGGPNKSRNTSNGGPNSRGSRPFCTYGNFLGYTIKRCYKLHGYPPSYRQKSKPNSTNSSNTIVNQISNNGNAHDTSNAVSNNLLQNMNIAQCQ